MVGGGMRDRRRGRPPPQAYPCSITASKVWSFGCPRSTPSGMRACWWALRKASERVQASKAARLSQVEWETYSPEPSPLFSSAKRRKPGTSDSQVSRSRQRASNSAARAGSTSNRFIAMKRGISFSSGPPTLPIMRFLHTMLRVKDLDASLRFWTDHFGMKLLRRRDYPEGKFTLAFVGYGDESDHTVIEL